MAWHLSIIFFIVMFLKPIQNPPKGKKDPPPKSTHATIYVAKSFPPWQSCVLNKMRYIGDVWNLVIDKAANLVLCA